MKSPTSKHSRKNNNNKKNQQKNKTKQQQHQQQKMFRFACLLPLFFFNSIRMQIWRIHLADQGTLRESESNGALRILF